MIKNNLIYIPNRIGVEESDQEIEIEVNNVYYLVSFNAEIYSSREIRDSENGKQEWGYSFFINNKCIDRIKVSRNVADIYTTIEYISSDDLKIIHDKVEDYIICNYDLFINNVSGIAEGVDY